MAFANFHGANTPTMLISSYQSMSLNTELGRDANNHLSRASMSQLWDTCGCRLLMLGLYVLKNTRDSLLGKIFKKATMQHLHNPREQVNRRAFILMFQSPHSYDTCLHFQIHEWHKSTYVINVPVDFCFYNQKDSLFLLLIIKRYLIIKRRCLSYLVLLAFLVALPRSPTPRHNCGRFPLYILTPESLSVPMASTVTSERDFQIRTIASTLPTCQPVVIYYCSHFTETEAWRSWITGLSVHRQQVAKLNTKSSCQCS